MSRHPYEGEFRLVGQPPRPHTPLVEQPCVVGVHLAPVGAPSALVLVCRAAGATAQDPVIHRVEQVTRWPAETPYETMREPVAALLRARGGRAGVAALVVNATEVSEAAVDVLDQVAQTVRFEEVQVTAGGRATEETDGWRVPDRDLVGVLQLLLQQGRLKAPKTLPLVTELATQLKTFTVNTGTRGQYRYEPAAGTGEDLVTALALACWWGERIVPAHVEEETSEFHAWSPEALRYEYEKRRIKGGPLKGTGPTLDGIG